MAQIFLSYAREDRVRVQTLVDALTAAGLSVFWDRQVPAGETWHGYIGRALAEARCVLVVWSSASLASDWVMEEAEEGKQRGVLVPVLFDRVQPPIGFRTIQAADLVDWNGDPASSDFEQLLVDVRRVVGEEAKIANAGLAQEAPTHPARPRRWTPMGAAGVGLAAIALIAAVYFVLVRPRAASPAATEQPQSPSVAATSQPSAQPSSAEPTAVDRFKELRDYAYSSAGLDLDTSGAAARAEARLRESPEFDLASFKAFRSWAYSSAGLDLSRPESQKWAEARMKESPPIDVDDFKKAFAYAYSSNGLNLTREQAAAWALKMAKRRR